MALPPIVKPNVVFFGDNVPRRVSQEAMQQVGMAGTPRTPSHVQLYYSITSFALICFCCFVFSVYIL